MSITFIEWLQTKNEQTVSDTNPIGGTPSKPQENPALGHLGTVATGNQAGNQKLQPKETEEEKTARISNTARNHINIAFDNIKKLNTNSAKLLIDEIMTLIQGRSTINQGQATTVVKNSFQQ